MDNGEAVRSAFRAALPRQAAVLLSAEAFRHFSRLSSGRAPARVRFSLVARATRRKITHLRGARAKQIHPLRPVLSVPPSPATARKRLPHRMSAPTTQQSTPSWLHWNSVSLLSIPANRLADVSASAFHFSLSFVL